ncbi:cytochrome P450 [Hypoxylon cercidicola]|nr:cytochrome P450 [Hypoxylon cercidicola]
MAPQVLRGLRIALLWMTSPTGIVVLGLLGVLSHRLYFIKGEHHIKAPLYVTLWTVVTVLIASVSYVVDWAEHDGSSEAKLGTIRTSVLVNCAFFLPLFASVVVYRLFQHALRDFPGPRLAASSKLWHFCYMFKTNNYILLENLRKRYGSIVRTGPQELTIIHPDILGVISGHGTPCIKGPVYDMQRPLFVSLNTYRTKEGYAPRRKRWDDALGLSAPFIPDKEARVYHFASLLIHQMKASAGCPINVTTWFSHFAFDIMTDLAFGRSFDLTKNLNPSSKLHHAPSLLSRGMSMLRFFMPAPWIGIFCIKATPYIPVISRAWNNAVGWAVDMCDVRLDQDKDIDVDHRKDAFSRFTISAQRDKDEGSLDRFALYGDAFTFAVAGSHTTSAALTMLFYELARRPELQERARREATQAGITAAAGDGQLATKNNMATTWENLPFLDGCINETMRLYPALPTAGIRQTVGKPIKVGETWIPPHTIIVAPRWSIGRLESAFEQPQEFIPERWTTKSHMVKNPRAFSPFANGRHTCPGKQLGLLEVRMAAAMILVSFEFSLDPKRENQTRVVDQLQDSFTATPGELEIMFKKLT